MSDKLKANDPVTFEIKGRRGAGVKAGVILQKFYNHRKRMWEYSIQTIDAKTRKSERWTLYRPHDKEDEGIVKSAHQHTATVQAKAKEFDAKRDEYENNKFDAQRKFLPLFHDRQVQQALIMGKIVAKIKYGNVPYPVKAKLWKVSNDGVYPIENGRPRQKRIQWLQVLDLFIDDKSLLEADSSPKTYQKMFA